MRLKSQNQALIFKSIRNPLSGKDPGLRTLIYAPNVLSENILINLQRLKTKQKLLQLTYGLGTVSRQQCRDKQNPGLPERQRWSLESRGPGSQSVCTAACWIEESCIEIGFRGTAEGSPQVSDYVVTCTGVRKHDLTPGRSSGKQETPPLPGAHTGLEVSHVIPS